MKKPKLEHQQCLIKSAHITKHMCVFILISRWSLKWEWDILYVEVNGIQNKGHFIVIDHAKKSATAYL